MRTRPRLLETLSKIEDSEVELIFIDDGSIDSTLSLLEEFRNRSNINISIIAQDNKGPGAARNAGLKVAKGKYVWFVDSDDDIKLEVLNDIKNLIQYDYDFMDFNFLSDQTISNSMNFEAGVHIVTNENRVRLIKGFGRIWTKVIKKDFIIDNNIYYPEYCIYEDNSLGFIYPLLVNKFIKLEEIAYIYNKEHPSVTRGEKLNPRFFDCLYTALYGFQKGTLLTNSSEERLLLEKKFISCYLLSPIGGLGSHLPSKTWLLTHKVMKQYRNVTKKLDINWSTREILKGRKVTFKVYFLFHWYLSHLLIKDQSSFFKNKRLETWGRHFEL